MLVAGHYVARTRRNGMDAENSGSIARQWRVGQWLTDGSMEAVAEINAQCLDFLHALAAEPARQLPEMFNGQLAAWRELSTAARAQLAASPYLLADAGFDDESRWSLPARRMVQDLPAVSAEPVFTGPGSEDFVRAVLGMTPACATRIAALRLRDLDWVVQHHPEWVRPRWDRQPRVWRHLLGA